MKLFDTCVMLGVACFAFSPAVTLAINGQNSAGLSPLGGWQAFEIVTQNDAIGSLADAGYGETLSRGTFDGLGLRRDGDRLSVWINHETSDAAISRVEIDLDPFRGAIETVRGGATIEASTSFVTAVGYAYNTIYDGGYHATLAPDPVAEGTLAVAAYGASFFDRFCSGTSHQANPFGAGRGFVDDLYLTGEEVSGGKFYALDEQTGALWEAPDLGLGSWENAAAIDTGESDHVALILASDVGGFPGDTLQLYVGRKGADANDDGQIDFLERNGLRGGQVYHFIPEAGASTTDLPDGAVSGAWNVSTDGALFETKLEDVHTNPQNGKQVVLGAQRDGVYLLDIDINLTAGGLLDELSGATLTQIDDDDVAPIGAPDNLVWMDNGELIVQEDGDGDGIFRLSTDGVSVTQIAAAASEPSGVIDASQVLGYEPGGVLLSSLQGGGSSGAQLVALISPDATPLTPGDYNGDGSVDAADYNTWVTNYGSTAAWRPDGNADGLVDAADYTVWRDALAASPAAIPEPMAVNLSGLVVLFRLTAGNVRRTELLE